MAKSGGVWVDRSGTVYCMGCAALMQFDTGECPIPFEGVDQPTKCGLCNDLIMPMHTVTIEGMGFIMVREVHP